MDFTIIAVEVLECPRCGRKPTCPPSHVSFAVAPLCGARSGKRSGVKSNFARMPAGCEKTTPPVNDSKSPLSNHGSPCLPLIGTGSLKSNRIESNKGTGSGICGGWAFERDRLLRIERGTGSPGAFACCGSKVTDPKADLVNGVRYFDRMNP